MATTITEALAEIKTIGKRIEKKRGFVGQFLFRQNFLKDPLENQGGSAASIAAERQGITDLETRVVALRRAIQAANAATTITLGGITRSVADWLVWRREVAPGRQAFLGQLRQGLTNARTQATQKGLQVRAAGQPDQTGENDVLVHIDEKALAVEIEQMEEVLGALDGQLSLKNATTVIEA